MRREFVGGPMDGTQIPLEDDDLTDEIHIDMYLDSTIKYVKEKQRKKANEVRLNNAAFGNNLYFVHITFPPSTEKFKALVDTGASNSLIHESVAEKLNINITPTTMRLSTATGSSTNAITGTTHLNWHGLIFRVG